MSEVILDTLIDSIKLVPFLFLTYLAMEYLEHKAGEKTTHMVRKAGKMGPLIGGVAGVLPQCGFSAAASNLYAGRVITLGTLIAIYLSTGDEMLPDPDFGENGYPLCTGCAGSESSHWCRSRICDRSVDPGEEDTSS